MSDIGFPPAGARISLGPQGHKNLLLDNLDNYDAITLSKAAPPAGDPRVVPYHTIPGNPSKLRYEEGCLQPPSSR